MQSRFSRKCQLVFVWFDSQAQHIKFIRVFLGYNQHCGQADYFIIYSKGWHRIYILHGISLKIQTSISMSVVLVYQKYKKKKHQICLWYLISLREKFTAGGGLLSRNLDNHPKTDSSTPKLNEHNNDQRKNTDTF